MIDEIRDKNLNIRKAKLVNVIVNEGVVLPEALWLGFDHISDKMTYSFDCQFLYLDSVRSPQATRL